MPPEVIYDLPSDSMRVWPVQWDKPLPMNPDYTCSAYDNCRTGWGSTHAATWQIVKDNPYISGMFIWTGFDYLGEPTPYTWPARSSYFGLIDLAGFPKDGYYFYQSEWTKKPMLHLFPHWNWQPGQTVDVWAYTNQDEVELFLNSQSLGKKVKTADTFQLVWKVPFAPGLLKAVAYKNGSQVLEKSIQTAGAPAKILLAADRVRIKADGRDLSFVTVEIADKNGVVVAPCRQSGKILAAGSGFYRRGRQRPPDQHGAFQGGAAQSFQWQMPLRHSGTRERGGDRPHSASRGAAGRHFADQQRIGYQCSRIEGVRVILLEPQLPGQHRIFLFDGGNDAADQDILHGERG